MALEPKTQHCEDRRVGDQTDDAGDQGCNGEPIADAGQRRCRHDGGQDDRRRHRERRKGRTDDDRPTIHRSQPEVDERLVVAEVSDRTPGKHEADHRQDDCEAEVGDDRRRLVNGGGLGGADGKPGNGGGHRQQQQCDDAAGAAHLPQHQSVRHGEPIERADGRTVDSRRICGQRRAGGLVDHRPSTR